MTTRVIPEQRDVICDVCQVVCSRAYGRGKRRMNGRLVIKRDALDWSDAACADATTTQDLCDSCLELICGAINAEAIRIHALSESETGKEEPD